MNIILNIFRSRSTTFIVAILVASLNISCTQNAEDSYKEAIQHRYSNPNKAIQLLNNATQLDYNFYDAWKMKFDIFKENNDIDNMISCLNQMTRIQPTEFRYYAQTANKLIEYERFTDAILIYNSYINTNSNSDLNTPSAYSNRALIKFGLEDYSSALNDINYAIFISEKSNSDAREFYRTRAYFKCSSEDYNGAVKDYEIGLYNIPDVLLTESDLINYGVALYNTGNIKKACESWRYLGEKIGKRIAYNYISKYCN